MALEHMLSTLPQTVSKLLKILLFGKLSGGVLASQDFTVFQQSREGSYLCSSPPNRLPVTPEGACLSGNKSAFNAFTF